MSTEITTDPRAEARHIDGQVGCRIRKRREQLGMSQQQLGQHLGLTFSQIQKYENGQNRIGAGRLALAADCLGVPVGYFFTDIKVKVIVDPQAYVDRVLLGAIATIKAVLRAQQRAAADKKTS